MRYVARKNKHRLLSWGVVGAIALIPLTVAACSTVSAYYPTFSTSISSITPTSNSQARVVVHIKNTSSASGTAHCSLELYSPDHSYSGFEYFESNGSVNGGQTVEHTVDVTVYRNGAHQVTVGNSTVRCY
jgi:hypothetical protein